MQQKDKQGIRRDGTDFLEDEGGKESGKRIVPFAAEMLVKGVVKSGRDKQGNIKVLLQKLKKGRGIIEEHILTV